MGSMAEVKGSPYFFEADFWDSFPFHWPLNPKRCVSRRLFLTREGWELLMFGAGPKRSLVVSKKFRKNTFASGTLAKIGEHTTDTFGSGISKHRGFEGFFAPSWRPSWDRPVGTKLKVR